MPFITVEMDIPRLNPTVSARLRLEDTQPGTPASSSQAVDRDWEKAFETQRAAAIASTLNQSITGRLSTTNLIPAGTDTFRAQTLIAETAPTPATTSTSPAEATTPAAAAGSSLLPLNQIAKEQGLLNRADIRIDPATNRWSAEWPSPSPFHYGMVLKPTLLQYIKEGQSFAFQNGTGADQTISNRGGEIVIASQGKETVLDSQGLKHLLQDKVKSNGFELYLTPRGSLVLATTGDPAKAMALAQ